MSFDICTDLDEGLLDAGDKLCVVEESPDYPGYLLFQALDTQSFYSRYGEWVSRYCVLNELFSLDAFHKVLAEDGWQVVFLKSCEQILRNHEAWSAPLEIAELEVTNPDGSASCLYDFQTFGLNRALERAQGATPEDRFYFWNFCAGAGKTLMASAGALELFNRSELDTVLYFTLQKLKINACRYVERTTGLPTVVNDGPAQRRAARFRQNYAVYCLNYDKAWADREAIAELVDGRRVLFVLDECQKVITADKKNRSRKALEELVKGAGRATVWPMSASVVNETPLRYRDVFNLGGNSRKNPLGSKADFESRYARSTRDVRIQTKTGGVFYTRFYDWNLAALHEVRHRVGDRVQSARKTDPGVREHFKGIQTVPVAIQLSAEDRRLYEMVIDEAQIARERGETLMPYYRLLRYICNNPEALRHTEDALGAHLAQSHPALVTGKHSAKMELLLDAVEGIRDSGDKVVVFTYWTNLSLDLLHAALSGHGIKHEVHYGVGMSATKANEAEQRFRSDHDTTVFLTSDAGAYGLNLPEARYVINYECPYSYDTLMQRSQRIDRADSWLNGLTSYVYITDDSVEERVWQINNERRALAAATQGTQEVLSYDPRVTRSETDNLAFLIFGPDAA